MKGSADDCGCGASVFCTEQFVVRMRFLINVNKKRGENISQVQKINIIYKKKKDIKNTNAQREALFDCLITHCI